MTTSCPDRFSKILKNIKVEYEKTIKTSTFNGQQYSNGNKAKEAFIRSQKLICCIHEFIKEEFVKGGVNPKKIYPPLGANKPEINLVGFLKKKNQDICVIPESWSEKTKEEIESGPLAGSIDFIGKSIVEKSIAINIRSQLSSLDKNFDTLYERTFAEAFNLHQRTPKLCMGEVYLIPTHEYDDVAMIKNKIVFKKISKLEKYINAFQAINNRTDYNINHHMYERVCLAIVDFRQTSPRLYSSTKDLISDGLLEKKTTVMLNELSIDNFVKDILETYSKRFDISNLR